MDVPGEGLEDESSIEHVDVRGWIVPLDKQVVPGWDRLPPAPSLSAWVAELRAAIEAPTDADWQLVGPAIVVLHEDKDALVQLCARIAVDFHLCFVRIPAECLEEPIPGLRVAVEALAPALVLLDRGRWSEPSNTTDGLGDAARLHALLSAELRSFNCAFPVLFVASSSSLDLVGPILCKAGAFDRVFAVAPLSKEALGNEFIDLLGPGGASAALRAMPGKLGMILRNEFNEPDARALAALQLRRIGLRQGRPVEFNDIVNLAIRGGVEGDDGSIGSLSDVLRRRVAAHEAGHAAMALIGSGGRNVPEYASIVPAKEFRGIVMESIVYRDSREEVTYADVQLRVRVSLAGRAAEEIVFGAGNVGSGAESDLERATRVCLHYFGYSGFAPGMDRPGVSGSNLAVVFNEMNAQEFERTYEKARLFLMEEYAEVLRILERHRVFMDAIAERLMWDPLVDGEEMIELAAAHGIRPARED